MAFPNAAISDIIATTIQNRSGRIADNVTDNNAILDRLKRRGNIRTFSGGNTIMEELSFAENGNAGWYSGYDLLPIAAQDVISSAEYSIKQAACPVIISGLEQLKNSGKERIIDLLEARVKVAESSMSNLMASGLYSDGTGTSGKQVDGLATQVAKVATNTVGGIDRSSWAFWKNYTKQATTIGTGATTDANIGTRFNHMWANLTRGTDRPDLILVDNNYWLLYMASLQAHQRFSSSDDANRGFTSVKFMNADVVLDGAIGGNMPSSCAYFLNTKYIHYRPHRDRNMVPLSPGQRYSVNQDAAVQILAWAGNMTMSGAMFQGILWEA